MPTSTDLFTSIMGEQWHSSPSRNPGVVRLHAEPDRESREFAITVRSDFHGHGLGRMLMQLIIEYARSLGLRVIEGRTLHENKTMLKMCREFGFAFLMDPEDARVTIVRLSLI